MLAALAVNWWSVVVRGLLALALGLLAWVRPEFFWASLILIFGVYAIVDGVFALVAAVRDESGGRWANLLEGMAGIGAGLLVLFYPGDIGAALVIVIGVWAIVTGLLEIAAAIRLRQEIAEEWLLGIAGLVSVAIGVLLIARPGFGRVGTTYVVGTYGILFGLLLVLLGLRLRTMAPAARRDGRS
jgi:uncharacterized membrane protein HdeD (DUF308 family)